MSYWWLLIFTVCSINGNTDTTELLMTDSSTIKILKLDTNEETIIGEGYSWVLFLDFHQTKNLVYWSDYAGGTISRIKVPSIGESSIEVVLTGGSPSGIAIDSINDHIYWGDHGWNRISRSDIDGSNTEIIVSNVAAYDVEIHTTARWIFFTNNFNTIEKCRFDGSDRQVIVSGIPGTENIALDISEERIYWSEIFNQQIKSISFDGSDVRLFSSTPMYPWGMDISNSYLFFSTLWTGKLYKIEKNNSTSSTFLHSTTRGNLMDVKIYKSAGICSNYKEIRDEAKRSANYELDLYADVFFNDFALEEGWYRVFSDNGDEMPSYPPGLNNCGSIQPIWLNGTLPTEVERNIERTACVQTVNSECESTIHINISRCDQNYYVYYLTNTSYNSSYCFGNGPVLCEIGFSSETGFYPGCSQNFPNETLTPTVSAVLVEGEVYSGFPQGFNPGPSLNPAFVCNFEHVGNSQYLYDVHWYIDGDKITAHTNIPFVKINNTYMYEEDWITTHNLNMEVRCAVRVRSSAHSVPSPYHFSPWFAAGVYPLKYDVTVVEGESVNISYVSTVPVGCMGSSDILKSNCHQSLYVFQPNKKEEKEVCTNQVTQKDIVFRTAFCGIQFSAGDWNESKNLQIFGYSDGLYNFKDRTTYVRLTSASSSGIFRNLVVPDLKVTVLDKDVTLTGRLCESYNDPHIRTFDGRYYHYMDVGEYVMYRNNRGPYWVHALFTDCGFGWAGSSCHCGIAIRSRTSLFIVRTCEKISRHQKFLLPRPQIELRSCNDDDMVIEETGRQFKISLPIGTEIRFRLNYGFISGITIKPTVFDIKNTIGLCGSLSSTKDPSDDYTHRYEGVVNNDQYFASSWKVSNTMTNEQLFTQTPTFQSEGEYSILDTANANEESPQYCSCNDEAGPTDDVSQFYSVHCNMTEVTENCRAEVPALINLRKRSTNSLNLNSFQRICYTDRIVKRSVLNTKRRIQRTVEDTDDVIEYSPLTYDDDVNSTVEELEFRNGWTEELANAFCTNRISERIQIDKYTEITEVEMEPYIESCIMDIKTVADTLFSEDTVFAIQVNTLMELSRNESLFIQYKDNENTTIFDYVTSLLCINNCSGNGLCVAGECSCEESFIGENCSKRNSTPPDNLQIPNAGLCGKSERICTRTNVYGEFLSSNVWCKLEHFKIVKDGKKFYTSEEVLKAVFRNSYLVSCELPSSRQRRSISLDEPEGYDLSLSHDGTTYGESATIIIYDDTCYRCNATTATCEFLEVCRSSNIPNTDSNTGIIVGTIIGTIFLFCLVFGIFILKHKKDKQKRTKVELIQSSASLDTIGMNDVTIFAKNATPSMAPSHTEFAGIEGDIKSKTFTKKDHARSKAVVSVGNMGFDFEDSGSYIRPTTPVNLFYAPGSITTNKNHRHVGQRTVTPLKCWSPVEETSENFIHHTGKLVQFEGDSDENMSAFNTYPNGATPISIENNSVESFIEDLQDIPKEDVISVFSDNSNDETDGIGGLAEFEDSSYIEFSPSVGLHNKVKQSSTGSANLLHEELDINEHIKGQSPIDIFFVMKPNKN